MLPFDIERLNGRPFLTRELGNHFIHRSPCIIIIVDFNVVKEKEVSSMVKAFILIWIVLYFFTGAIACSTGVSKPASISQEQGKTTDTNAMVQRLLDDKVVAFYQWEIDTDTTLLCIARDLLKPEFSGEPTNVFSIIDRRGKLLYQIDGVEIRNISTSVILRNMGVSHQSNRLRRLDLADCGLTTPDTLLPGRFSMRSVGPSQSENHRDFVPAGAKRAFRFRPMNCV